MASGKKASARKTKGRHRRQARQTDDGYVKWLRAGAVTVGLGAAIVTGPGIAAADTGSADGSTSTESSSSDTTAESSNDASASDPSGRRYRSQTRDSQLSGVGIDG